MKFEILIISLWTLSGNSRLLLSRYSLLHNEYARFKRASWFNWREFGLKTCTQDNVCVHSKKNVSNEVSNNTVS